MKKIIYLVTGAAGHLGSCIITQLLNQGCLVRGFVKPSELCANTPLPPGLGIIAGDVCRPESLEPLFESPFPCDFIFIHCAGLISIYGRYDKRLYKVNVAGTKNVAEACMRHNVRRLVYISSVHAIPEQPAGHITREIQHFLPGSVTGCYAKTKAEATQYVLDCAEKGLNAVVVHPSGIIGPGSSCMGSLIHMITSYAEKGMVLAVNGGYDFVDVRDVAAGAIAAARSGQKGECYILSNQYVTLKELFTQLSSLTGQRSPRLFLPMWLARCAAPFAQLYYRFWKKTPVFTPYALYTLTSNGIFSHEKADRDLGYHPRPLYETLRDTLSSKHNE